MRVATLRWPRFATKILGARYRLGIGEPLCRLIIAATVWGRRVTRRIFTGRLGIAIVCNRRRALRCGQTTTLAKRRCTNRIEAVIVVIINDYPVRGGLDRVRPTLSVFGVTKAFEKEILLFMISEIFILIVCRIYSVQCTEYFNLCKNYLIQIKNGYFSVNIFFSVVNTLKYFSIS